MNWLNYHHLLYFYIVAREGSIAAACSHLHVAQPTVSAQLKTFETALGTRLFKRVGRKLLLTDTGRMVYRYADDIFNLGKELQDALRGRSTARSLRLVVGVNDALPRLVAYRLLAPVRRLPEPVQIYFRAGSARELLADLSIHELDLVVSDAPSGPDVRVRAYDHLLGECPVTVVGSAELARQYRDHFPDSLDGAPFLLPAGDSSLRRSLDRWFEQSEFRPEIVSEFEDSALMKVFGQTGLGLLVVPDIVSDEVCEQYGLEMIGKLDMVREQFFAISLERKVQHPAVLAVLTAAHKEVFGAAR